MRELLSRTLPILLVALLAGCTAARPAAVPSPTLSTQVDAKQGAGTIDGVVTDEQLAPLEKVRVQILEAVDGAKPLEVFTDVAGKFTAAGLNPGKYHVSATLIGYREVPAKLIDVLDGQSTRVAFALPVLNVQKPFSETKLFTFYYDVSWCLPPQFADYNSGINCQAIGWDNNATYQFNVDEANDGPLATLVHEMQWTTTSAVCTGGMKGDLYSPQQSPLPALGNMRDPARSPNNPYHWENDKVTTPTRLLVPRDGADASAMLSTKRTELNKGKPIDIAGKWSILLWATQGNGAAGLPLPVDCMVEQKLTAYLSLFHISPAPADFSALPKG